MASENILVIGGGPTGLEAARGIADLGYKVTLVEKRERLGELRMPHNMRRLRRICEMQKKPLEKWFPQ